MNKNTKIKAKYLLGAVFFLLLCYSLFYQITRQQNLHERWKDIKEVWKSAGIYAVFILMLCNWGVEALKWRFMLKPLQKISFLTALQSIFTGCAVTMITPNRMGEFGGRILFVEAEQRLRAISISIIGSISQTLITFIFGYLGLLYFFKSGFPVHEEYVTNFILYKSVWVISIGMSLLLALLFFFENKAWSLLQRISLISKYFDHLSIRNLYSHKTLLRILGFSFFRYLIFILQYLIMFKTLHIKIELLSMMAMTSVFFLSMALAPTIGFLELPVRSQLGIVLFGVMTSDMLGIQSATITMWIVNIIIPAVIGLLIILFTKYNSK